MGDGPPRVLDQARDRSRRKHYSMRTEEAYVEWTRRFVLHHKAPARHGGGAGRGVPDPPRGREGGVGIDTEPGQESGPFPLQGGSRGASSLARRHRVGEAARAPAGRADPRGGRIDPDASQRHGGIDDPAPLRDRYADHGVCAPAGEGISNSGGYRGTLEHCC
jgi:hypothetical protein